MERDPRDPRRAPSPSNFAYSRSILCTPLPDQHETSPALTHSSSRQSSADLPTPRLAASPASASSSAQIPAFDVSRYNAAALPMQAHSHSHDAAIAQSDGSHLWGAGMKTLMSSLIGAPPDKSRPSGSTYKSDKSLYDASQPLHPRAVEAATSSWQAPRDTVAMTVGFSNGYEEQSFAQPMWQSPPVAGYANDQQQQPSHGGSGFAAPYPPQSSASGMPMADAPRSRPGSELLTEPRDYSRRPQMPHSRSSTGDYPPPVGGRPMNPDTSDSSYWPAMPDHSAGPGEGSSMGHPDMNRGGYWSSQGGMSGRRSNPPPLPETRGQHRGGWSGPPSSSLGFEGGPYEFPQTSLGKRPYEDEASNQGIAGDHAADAAFRRYSLAPNMVFSRTSGQQPNAGMMTYRPPGMDPRRPSLGNEPTYASSSMMPMQQSRGYAGAPSWYSSSSSSSPHPTGMSANMGTSPPTPRSPAPSAKRHRRQSSVSGGGSAAAAQAQNSILANMPYHVTTDIVLRAPPGSKMDDVFYDQHCEIQTGMPDPPPSDFEVENNEDRPRLQTDKLRFPGDLYTPRWVRGTGNAREAWCDRCEHGNWLQLKNSQYWYDQVHKHGISSVSGLRFTPPTQLRVYADAAGTVEGKCHQCKEWILICTAKRRRTFAAFFKHAHACHSYRKASAVGNGPIVEHNPGHKKKNM